MSKNHKAPEHKSAPEHKPIEHKPAAEAPAKKAPMKDGKPLEEVGFTSQKEPVYISHHHKAVYVGKDLKPAVPVGRMDLYEAVTSRNEGELNIADINLHPHKKTA